MYPTTDATDTAIDGIEAGLQREFPQAGLKLATQSFARHVELWVYVLNVEQYERVLERCRELTAEKHLEDRNPEIWLVVRPWPGPWPGGESLHEIERRREEFKRAHNFTVGTPS